MKLLCALALAGALALPAAAANAPIPRHTAKDMALARGALLTMKDIGKGWTAVRTTQEGSLTCDGFDPSMAGIVETGAAARGFRGGERLLGQLVWVFRTQAQAATLWRRVVVKKLLACLVAAGRSAGGLTVTKVRSGELTVPKLAERTAGYRLIVTARVKAQTVHLYYDSLLLSQGRTLSLLTFGSAQPVPSAVELVLARTVAKRLGTRGVA